MTLTPNPVVTTYRRIPLPARDVVAMCGLAALVFLPWLGSVGLWDCWEPHYGEVARMMIAKHDFVYPWWQDSYFFSKPVGLMWLEVLPMMLAGTLSPAGPVGVYTEWAMRLPVAMLAIAAVGMVTYTSEKLFNRRVGLISGFAMVTSPLYFLMARQAITDSPFVACMTMGLCCFLIAEFDPALRIPEGQPGTGLPDPARTAMWWYAFYGFVAFATLFKSLLPPGLVGVALIVYLAVTGDWSMLKRARIPTGVLLFALIALPWVVVLCFFDGREAEGQVFWHRFFVHDLGLRLIQGVHTTTPKDTTTFAYFIEQLGFGLFPWVTLVPGAMVAATRQSARDPDPKGKITVFLLVWAVTSFAVVSLSATQFHHYGFPVVPPLCVLFALFADQLWEEGLDRHLVAVLTGLAFFALVAQNIYLKPKHLTDLFVYNYDRTYPVAEVNPKIAFAVILGGGGTLIGYAWLTRSRNVLFAAFAAVALVFAGYTSWEHWRQLSFHWAQRDVFWTYYQDACPRETHGQCNPNAPLIAWEMNWKGETFYSQNRIRQLTDVAKLREVAALPGRKYVITEPSRFPGLAQNLAGHRTQILDKTSVKYVLVAVD
jgi:4-amino-4-deoxy-L-arabinose transferase-like glycosyltransferase